MTVTIGTDTFAQRAAQGAGVAYAAMAEQVRHLGDTVDGWFVSRPTGGMERRPGDSRSLRRRRRRTMALAVLGGWLVLLVSAVYGLGDSAGPRASEISETRVSAKGLRAVAEGESLWQIANEVRGADEDVREVVDELMIANDLETSTLRAGQLLALP